ncbi:MAG: Rieske (2Fe-2S) protein [Gammaproteobacteria bacterium]|nr:Rieske (2Fe-2S) protein [Gammaproteobacteria bacterium]
MRFQVANMSDIPEQGSKGFIIEDGDNHLEGFLVRQGQHVYAYINECPHTGVNLNWSPDTFLSTDQAFIQCAMHGALFRLTDGFCVRGPCINQSLQTLEVNIEHEDIWITMSKF